MAAGKAQRYTFMTYKQAHCSAASIGSALHDLGAAHGGTVGIYGANCPEWMLAVKGCDFCGAVVVPLYNTFGPAALSFIIAHSQIQVIFCASNMLPTLCLVLAKERHRVTQVIVWAVPGEASAQDTIKTVRLCQGSIGGNAAVATLWVSALHMQRCTCMRVRLLQDARGDTLRALLA